MVYGKGVEGMVVVKRIEACGSRTGKTLKPVVISDCGEVSRTMYFWLSVGEHLDTS